MTAERAARLTALGVNWHPTNRGNTNEAEWEAQLARLVAYKAEHGDCNVSQRWAENPQLGSWVRTQRVGKKALDRGVPREGMTAKRVAQLEALGFAWAISSERISKQNRASNTDEAAWEKKLARLAAYKVAHGDCNVPRGWAEDPQLATWVNTQRRRKKELDRGDPSVRMTVARAARLEALGFAWASPRARGGAARR
jgi:hypothetical protein